MMQIFPDIPRVYTALAEWTACMVIITNIKLRFRGWRLAGFSAGMLAVQSAFLVATKDVGIWLWLPCMITAVLLMIGFIYFAIDGNLCDAVYCGLHAFVMAEFAASVEWLLYCFFFLQKNSYWANILCLVVVYTVIFFFNWRLIHNQRPGDGYLRVQSGELPVVLTIAVSVFAISNVGYLQIETPFKDRYADVVGLVRAMIDFSGVTMMYAYHVLRNEIRARQERDIMHNMLRNQYLQYWQSKESIDVINYMYHDLKHQIAVLRSEEDGEKRNEHLNQMEKAICQYEMQNKTGNKIVDTILTTKSVTCDKYGISLNCVADGTLMDFMDVIDICSILGNALDNAIECERKIPDKEKRLIHMAIFAQKNFLILRFENYFEGELSMQEGVPVTTKTKKREFHGFGIKSIKYAVKKYDGAVSINKKDNWFELKVLIPIRRGNETV